MPTPAKKQAAKKATAKKTSSTQSVQKDDEQAKQPDQPVAVNIVDTAQVPHAAPVGRTHNSPPPKD